MSQAKRRATKLTLCVLFIVPVVLILIKQSNINNWVDAIFYGFDGSAIPACFIVGFLYKFRWDSTYPYLGVFYLLGIRFTVTAYLGYEGALSSGITTMLFILLFVLPHIMKSPNKGWKPIAFGTAIAALLGFIVPVVLTTVPFTPYSL